MLATHRIPTFINDNAESANAAVEALSGNPRFDPRVFPPQQLAEAIRTEIASGTTRVAVAGGDGTLRTAAGVLAESGAELAVIPGGTLNHFAKDLGIPEETDAAVETALNGVVRTADVAWVNDRLFLNTSSVGAYVLFVRTRERLERRLGYHLASLVALIRITAHLSTFRVVLETGSESRTYETPLVFIGVGERELKAPLFGNRVPNGASGLHVLVVRGRTRARVAALALAAVARGIGTVAQTPLLDSFLVDRCRIELRRPHGNVALDGEIIPMVAPLEYRVDRGALKVVVPRPAGEPQR